MSARPRLLPPADLLGRVDGVAQTLQRGRRLHTLGWLAFAVSVVQGAIIVFTSDWWRGASTVHFSELRHNWPFAVATLVAITGILFINWTRLWVRESQQPFRYTFSIDDFAPIDVG